MELQIHTNNASQNELAQYAPNIVSRKIRGLDNSKLHELTIAGEFQTMATVRRNNTLDAVQALIEAHLLHLDEVLNLSRRLSDMMVMTIAEDIFDVGYVLSFEELARFFKELRQGEHGSMYQGLNSENVCKALANFMQSRSAYIGQKSEDTSNSHKVRRERSEDESVNLTVDEMKERFNARFLEANDL